MIHILTKASNIRVATEQIDLVAGARRHTSELNFSRCNLSEAAVCFALVNGLDFFAF